MLDIMHFPCSGYKRLYLLPSDCTGL